MIPGGYYLAWDLISKESGDFGIFSALSARDFALPQDVHQLRHELYQ